MSCPQCDRLRAELAAARDELAEWRRQEREGAPTAAEEARFLAARRIFGLTRAEARLLLFLISRAGQLVRREAALDVVASGEDTLPAVVGVRICALRRALTRAGLTHGIGTEWGTGYSMDPRAASAISARLDERAAA